MKNIGYDSRWNGQHGIGRFAVEVSDRLNFSHHFINNTPPTKALSEFSLGRWANQSGAKAIYSPGYIPPCGTKIPFAFTIHDLNHIDVPHNSSLLKRAYYRIIIRPAIDRAYRVLTVSEFSRQRIIEWSGCNPEKVCVVGNGVSKAFSINTEKQIREYRYLFCCSNRKGHKNEYRLLHAFVESGLSNDLKLVFTGYPDNGLKALIQNLGLTEAVIFTGLISEADLSSWYRGAEATVFPSLYEGFGLPVIESMACGTPVIASNTTSLPEVGGNAGYYVDPLDIENIAQGIRRVTSDNNLRSQMCENGLIRARAFTWDRTASLVKKAIGGIV